MVYGLMLAFCAALVITALVAGVWLYVGLAVLFGALFAYAAPFVLGRRWRPRSPAATRRPVVRRRR